MERRVSLLSAWLGVVALLWLPALAGAQEVQIWKNRDGEAIDANPLHYDLESKMVTFQLANGNEIEYPFADLDAGSRFRVFSDSKIQESLKEQDWEFPASYFVNVILIIVAVALAFWLTFGFVCFWMSARMVTGEIGVRFHLGGFLKYLAVTIVLALIGNTVIYWAILSQVFSGDSQFDAETIADGGNGFLQFVFAVLGFLVPLFVISSHYEISMLRSFCTLLVYNLISVVAAVVLVILVVILIGAGAPVVEEYGYGEFLLDEWLLKPIGIL